MAHKNCFRVTEESLKILGQIVQCARKEAGITMAEVGLRAGVERSTIARLEKGDPGVSIGLLLTVVWLLDIPLFQGIAIGHRENRSQISTLLNALGRNQVQRVRGKKEKYDDNF